MKSSASGFKNDWHEVWSLKYVCFLLHFPSSSLSCWGRVVLSKIGRERGWPQRTLSWTSGVWLMHQRGCKGAGWQCRCLLPIALALFSFFFQRGSCLRGLPGLLSGLPSQSPARSRCAEGFTSAACMQTRSGAPRRRLCPPGTMLVAFASLLSCLLTSGEAKAYSRCELARVLQDFGLDGYRGYSLADCENPSPWRASPPSHHHFLPPSASPSSFSPKGCGLRSFLSLSSHL